MLEHNKYNDKLVREHRELLKKAKETADEKEKARFLRLAEQKHNEMLVAEFGDKNFKRFNR